MPERDYVRIAVPGQLVLSTQLLLRTDRIELLLYLLTSHLDDFLRQGVKEPSWSLLGASSRNASTDRMQGQVRELLAPILLPVLTSIQELEVRAKLPMYQHSFHHFTPLPVGRIRARRVSHPANVPRQTFKADKGPDHD